MALPYGTCPLPMSPPHVLCPLSPSLRPISPSTRPLSPAICPMPPAPYSTSPSLCPSPCVPCPLPCVPRPQPHTSRPQPCVPAGAQAQCHPPRWLQRDRTPPWDTGAPLGSPPPTSPAQWLHVPGRCDKVTTRGGVSRIQGVSGTHVCPVPVLPLTSQGSAPRGRFCFQKPPRSRGAPGAAVPGMAACWGTWTGRHVLSVATGAGAIYLLYRTVADGLSSAPDSTECYRLESPDHREGLPVEEVLNRKVCEELLEMLRVQQDGRSRSAILRSITRCIHLMDTEKPTCSPEHIELVASCLDDPNRDTKIQALNTLRAFVTRSLFTDKIRDYYPKILDMVTCSRDMGVHLAELQLLNALPVPPNIEPLLRRTVPNLLGFLQLDNHNIQLQVLRLLVTLSRMEELLPDILNCQVRPPVPRPVGFAGDLHPRFHPGAAPKPGRCLPAFPQPGSSRNPEPLEQLAAGEAALGAAAAAGGAARGLLAAPPPEQEPQERQLLPLRGPFRRELRPGRPPHGHVRPPRPDGAGPGVQTRHEAAVAQAGWGGGRCPEQAQGGQHCPESHLALRQIRFLGDVHSRRARRSE
ncbi:armadillo repeat-containing protein 12 isoform X1 [Anas acuta]|uniref:armadillo repeat-containing protein 12 isoform X1 n=1 Tax=Anas acuta TaxID=28680 RepID=UPI0035C8968C